MNMSIYTGPNKNAHPDYPRYTVTVDRPDSQRTFTGIFYSFNWEFKGLGGPCLYVGNRQAGPIYEVDNPNDSVIQGSYEEYKTDGPFGTDFIYSKYDTCTDG